MGLKLCSTLDLNKLIWQAGLIYTLAGSTKTVAEKSTASLTDMVNRVLGSRQLVGIAA
jgi:hypothetical protein